LVGVAVGRKRARWQMDLRSRMLRERVMATAAALMISRLSASADAVRNERLVVQDGRVGPVVSRRDWTSDAVARETWGSVGLCDEVLRVSAQCCVVMKDARRA